MMIFLSLALGARYDETVLDKTAYDWHFHCAACYLRRNLQGLDEVEGFLSDFFSIWIQHQLVDFY